MTLKQQLGKLKCKNFLFLTIAGMVNAFGVTMFIAPVDLYDSGISGTSILLSQLTPEWLSLSFFLMVLNIPLFLYGLRKQGVVFTIYAIYTVVVYSFGAWLIRCTAGGCKYRIATCRIGSASLRYFWRADLRYRKWYGDSIWRSDGRHRSSRRHLCKTAGNHGGYVCDGI